jgi:hypothetical protein
VVERGSSTRQKLLGRTKSETAENRSIKLTYRQMIQGVLMARGMSKSILEVVAVSDICPLVFSSTASCND